MKNLFDRVVYELGGIEGTIMVAAIIGTLLFVFGLNFVLGHVDIKNNLVENTIAEGETVVNNLLEVVIDTYYSEEDGANY